MKENQTDILIDVSDKVAQILNHQESTLGIVAPYVVACASLIASVIVGVISYRASRSAEKTSHEIGKQNVQALDKNRYIEIISKERAQWIETVRGIFNEFNTATYMLATELKYLKKNPEEIDQKLKYLDELSVELEHNWAKTYLYINPTEIVPLKMAEIKSAICDHLFIEPSLIPDFDIKIMLDYHPQLIYLQNVILKSEWKRLKQEVQVGRELTDEETNKITKEVAEKQMLEFYEKLLADDLK
ncbi:hypothetical protein MOC46_02390 [Bacillus spizizenii]|nr:hypothetical protein [Bacillus spizizenii]MCY8394734.1 hypothetical protein [Bacillus spizizenii]